MDRLGTRPAARLRAPLGRALTALWEMPPTPPVPPVRVRGRQGAFVAALWIAGGALATWVMPWHGDWAAGAIAAMLVAAMAAYAVASFGGVNARWSASGFFHLAFSFAIGPPAILAMAVGESLGSTARRRAGLFRTLFNIADHFLADTAAWLVFRAVAGPHPGVALLAVAGVLGAMAESSVNRSLIAAVTWLVGLGSGPRRWLANLATSTAFVVPFGMTAAGATLLYRSEGTFGILTLVLPLAIVQGALVALARSAHAYAVAQETRAREREALLRERAEASQRAVDASETERHRIAADLHDSVIQDVSGLFITASALERCLVDDDDAAWAHNNVLRFVRASKELAAASVQELRTLMVELAPPLLDEEGLGSAIRQLLTRLDRDGLRWVLECTDEALDNRQQRVVYRCIQEALRNVVKHAKCRTVWITVRIADASILASVRDDGRGFTPDERIQRRRRGHVGLGLLEETVRHSGGQLVVTSAPGQGTTVRVALPLVSAEDVEPEPPPEPGTEDGSTAIPRTTRTARARGHPTKPAAAAAPTSVP